MKTLSIEELASLNPRLLQAIEYRKSGLSLNHICGCPLDCAYCIRHTYDNFGMKVPHALMSDEQAVDELMRHPFFKANHTPIQLLNRATDPFLPDVKPHTFTVLELLNKMGLTNHVLVITRFRISHEDCARLNEMRSIRLTLLITYSGIDDPKLEPVKSAIAEQSLEIAFASAQSYKVILYWRPIVPGLNDSNEHLDRAVRLSRQAHATVFTGLFYREEMQEYYRSQGLPEPYDLTARRKILPKQMEDRILAVFGSSSQSSALFRKTSCAISYAHNSPDYNGHFGIRELCDICPIQQVTICKNAFIIPTRENVEFVADAIGGVGEFAINSYAIQVSGINEQRRYFVQHALGFQVHDTKYPHRFQRHGRADVGWGKALEQNIV